MHSCCWNRLFGQEGLDDLYQRTGAPLNSAYALPQLRVFYTNPNNTDTIKAVSKWTTLSAVCLSRWRGSPFTTVSYSEASWTGLFNFRRCVWDSEATSCLPPLCQSSLPDLNDFAFDNVVDTGKDKARCIFVNNNNNNNNNETNSCNEGASTNPYLDRWPELQNCRFFLGLGDGACANIGSNCTSTSRIAVTIGTSAATRVVLPLAVENTKPATPFVVPKGLFCYRINATHILMGGALTDGGSVFEWAQQLLNLHDDNASSDSSNTNSVGALTTCLKEVLALLEDDYSKMAGQGMDGIPKDTIVPFLSGERSTGFRTGATFSAVGLTRDTTPARFLKSCLEGVVMRLAVIIRCLREQIPACTAITNKDDADSTNASNQQPDILVSGGALEKNKIWRQMIADCTGLCVHLDTTVTEATSRGVALLISNAIQRQTDNDNSSNNNNDDDYGGSLVVDPILGDTETSVPSESPGRMEYWRVASRKQEALIDAMDPLWSGTEN